MSTEDTRAVIAEFDRLLKIWDVDGLAALFAEEIDWEIPGDTETVPWIGKRATRAQARAFYEEDVPRYLTPDRFDVDATLVEGDRVVQEFTVRDGRIIRYVMHEVSWLVSQAVRP